MKTIKIGTLLSLACLVYLASASTYTAMSDRADRLRLREVTVQSHEKFRTFKNARFDYAMKKSKGDPTSLAFTKAEVEYKVTDGKVAYKELESLQNEWRDLVWRHPDWSAMFNFAVILD